MEVAGPEYQLVKSRRYYANIVQLVFEEQTRSYYLIHRRDGVRIQFEYAGTEENEALEAFEPFFEQAKTQ